MTVLEAIQLRIRIARELSFHRRESARALRQAGTPRLRAWRRSRLPAFARERIIHDCLEAFGDTGERPWRRVPGMVPAGLFALSLALLSLGPIASLVRDSVLKRMPLPGGSAQVSPNASPYANQWMRSAAPLSLGDFRVLHRPDAFAYEIDTERVPGGGRVAVVRMTPNLARLLALPAAPAPLPANLWYLFRGARTWRPLPARGQAGLTVYVVSRGALPKLREVPWASDYLEDLTYARWSVEAALAGWLILALLDLMGLARRQTNDSDRWRHVGHGALYWAYALLTLSGLALFFVTFCGYMVDLWPKAGAAGFVFSLLGFLLLGLHSLRWCLEDQRYRCRTCLRRLHMPITVGRFGGILLAAPVTEYVCPHGHGRLLVPDPPSQPHPREQWTFAADWWQELAAGALR